MGGVSQGAEVALSRSMRAVLLLALSGVLGNRISIGMIEEDQYTSSDSFRSGVT